MLSIRRRGRLYHCRGTVRVGHQTRTVEEHSTGCSERALAEAYKAKLEHEIQQELLYGSIARRRALTFADAGELYIGRPGGLHPNDVWRIGELNEILGDMPIVDLPKGWSRFKSKRCAGLAPATVDRFRATLQAAINYACQEWEIVGPLIPRVRFKNQRIRWLTKLQQELLLASYAPHVRSIATTLCYQGCRSQEALQLRWEHVDFERRAIWFPRTKTSVPRMVAMHERVLSEISDLFLTRGRPDLGHVFLSARGKPYSDTRDYKLPGGNPIRRAHETACRRAGIEDFRVHDWRHHWASWCVMSGIDVETIKRMGGWKSLRMLERYAAVSTDHMAEAMTKLA